MTLRRVTESDSDNSQISLLSFLCALQCTYQSHILVENAIICLPQRACTDLDEAGTTVGVMFSGLSSAWHTIKPAQFGDKIPYMQVDSPLVTWKPTASQVVCSMQGCRTMCKISLWATVQPLEGQSCFLSVHTLHIRRCCSEFCHAAPELPIRDLCCLLSLKCVAVLPQLLLG